MDKVPTIKLYSITIDCIDPAQLARFYADLMAWDTLPLGEDYTGVYPSGTAQGAYPCLLLLRNPAYVPPVWPDEPDKQRQMAHIDFAVDDIEAAARHAIACGAKEADQQFSANWRVMIDPEGHPFCLCGMKEIIDSPQCRLL